MCMYMYVMGSAMLLTSQSCCLLFSASGPLHVASPGPGMTPPPLHSDGSFHRRSAPQPSQVAASEADFIPAYLPLSFFFASLTGI